MIASPSGAWAGVGFAIPVDTVKRIVQQLGIYCIKQSWNVFDTCSKSSSDMDMSRWSQCTPYSISSAFVASRQLIKHGYIKRAYLGLHLATEQLNEHLARSVGQITGVLILKMDPGSPAEKAGKLYRGEGLQLPSSSSSAQKGSQETLPNL